MAAQQKKWLGAWLPVIIWMGVIFWFSAQTGEESGQMSGWLMERISRAVGNFISEDTLHLIIRKGAHMTEYAVLGLLSARAVRTYRADFLWYAVLICAGYAASDELHQVFVPGRGPAVRDVLIDVAGALIGIIVFRVVVLNKESA